MPAGFIQENERERESERERERKRERERERETSKIVLEQTNVVLDVIEVKRENRNVIHL